MTGVAVLALALALDEGVTVGMVVDEVSEIGFLRGEGCALVGG